MTTPSKSTGEWRRSIQDISKRFSSIGERRPSISLTNNESSGAGGTRTRRMSTTKVVDNRPKHLILGEFELANVV